MSWGRWIRIEWIEPTPDRISKCFLEKGIRTPDEMSAVILYGYREYLNDRPADLDTLLAKK